MNKKCRLFIFALIVSVNISLAAQTHTSVPLGDPVYYVLEQAEMRGLCASLSGAKPYSRAKVLSVIGEILVNESDLRFGRLSESERGILEQFKRNFSSAGQGLDLVRGAYNFENESEKVHLSGELGVGFEFVFGGGFITKDNDLKPAADTALVLSFLGDLGLQASYGFTISGGVFRIPRENLGSYERYYSGFTAPSDLNFGPTTVTTYGEPLSFFPYTYKKHWDTFVWNVSDISNSGHEPWPNGISIGYSMTPEFAGEFLDGHISYRAARLDREWGAMTNNASLVLNRTAEPFLGAEVTVAPFSWLSFSSLAGVLEYDFIDSKNGIRDDAARYQNGFSVNLLKVNIKNYVQMDVGSTAIWPKRFELGYLFPLAEKFLYQNNVGDFDNMSLFFNLQGQYPGLGKLWGSFYLDEANPVNGNLFELDRQMFAFQFGASARIPWLAFGSVKASYTKIEPYTYTHNRVQVPWYGDNWMETGYTNSGRGLGSYLPPNSDEILARFESVPTGNSVVSFQYQLIRHGAVHGDKAVDGSSLYSELDPAKRNRRPELKKHFLHDGAYEWMHIFKLGGEYSLTSLNVPVKLFAEMGCVYSYYTDISGQANDGKSYNYKIVDTSEYPKTFRLIGVLGVRVFPK